MGQYQGVLGIFSVLAIAYLFSRNKKAIKWKPVLLGLALQIGFAVAILGIPSLNVPGVFRFVFDFLNVTVTALVDFTNEGSKFLFGPLAESKDPWGFIFAFRALPTIIFFSAVMSGLYYLGVLQKVVKAFAWVMQKTMKTSGAETLNASANIFIGQTEAPLLVKPYIPKMTNSEIFCVMTAGMATIAAGVEGAYVGMLKDRIQDIAGHLLTASVMGAIGALIVAKIIFPETEEPLTAGKSNLVETEEKVDSNVLEAVSRGASDGISLALNVGAMLIVFISLIAIFDALIGKVGIAFNIAEPLSFSMLAGKVLQPMAWLIGIPWEEAAQIGGLLGKKIILNEFVAFLGLSQIAGLLSDRTVIIASYALCGFANISSIGIQIGGIGVIAGKQKSTIAKLGLLAVLAGSLACFLSASVAGILY